MRDWFPLLDYVNLIFHEAGHWIWALGGEMLGSLGGSVTQVLVPLVCAVWLALDRHWIGSCLSVWWAGENLITVSRYIGDARALLLPLLGGDGAVHDWYFLLGLWGQRESDTIIAQWVWWCGIVVMCVAIVGIGWRGLLALRQRDRSVLG